MLRQPQDRLIEYIVKLLYQYGNCLFSNVDFSGQPESVWMISRNGPRENASIPRKSWKTGSHLFNFPLGSGNETKLSGPGHCTEEEYRKKMFLFLSLSLGFFILSWLELLSGDGIPGATWSLVTSQWDRKCKASCYRACPRRLTCIFKGKYH